MKKWGTFLLSVMLISGLAVQDAAAKRFGGRFAGMGRTKTAFSSLFSKKSTKSLTNRSVVNKQRGFLRGLLVGGLLASLLMGHGFSAALLSWLLIASLILFMMNLYRRKRQIHRI